MQTKGTVYKYPDNVDTDVIIPARYLNTPDAQELAKHCMEDIDPEYVRKVKPGDVMVAGWNFGCGSSREHAPSTSSPVTHAGAPQSANARKSRASPRFKMYCKPLDMELAPTRVSQNTSASRASMAG